MKELRFEDKNSGKGTNMEKCKKLDKTTLVKCRSARVCPERLKILKFPHCDIQRRVLVKVVRTLLVLNW